MINGYSAKIYGHDVCVLCNENVEEGEFVKLRKKGSDGINKASEQRGESLQTIPGQNVHIRCRRDYCLRQNISKAQGSQSSSTGRRGLVRKAESSFSYKTDCFYCGTSVNLKGKKKTSDAFRVTTIETKETVLKICSGRGDDAWAELVRARLLNVHDLPAADAIYHQTCSVNFRTGKQIPKVYADERPEVKKSKIGRPQDEERSVAFLKVMKFLKENDDEQITIQDLINEMQEYLGADGGTAYGFKHMKTKVKEHFGDDVIITEINGKQNVVTFRRTAESILHEFHSKEKNADQHSENRNIIQTAARLIKNDIQLMKTSNERYPTIDDIEGSLDFLPESLLLLLKGIICGKEELKIASIGQSIIQAARPRVIIAPLQIGLGVQLQHRYASRFLIDTLNRHGFCSSYSEVLRFRQNAAVDQGTDIPDYNGQFVQYVADNVDHNIRTLDGNNTFHGMGIINTVTPGTKSVRSVPRRKVKSAEILSSGVIKIQPPSQPRRGKIEIKYQEIVIKEVVDPTANVDILWKCSLLFGIPRPSWSGTMQAVHEGNHKGQSSINFLPMIDMNPSDETCISSTLNFISEHAKHHNIAASIITFDQPLWWKAYYIINTEPMNGVLRNVIVRLGAFHTEMSFLGSLGHLMAGSGIRDILELIYASNAVDHMLTGKAVARAFRGHSIVDAALNALLYCAALEVAIPYDITTDGRAQADEEEPFHSTPETLALTRENNVHSGDVDNSTTEHLESLELTEVISKEIQAIKDARSLFTKLINKEAAVQQVNNSKFIDEIKDRVQREVVRIKEESRTAALWVQYMDMVDILRRLIKAERTANWELHLQALNEMLPYLAASGHNNYLKCAHLYLQAMVELPNKYPDVYQSFLSGLHPVRRSNRFWAGLPTDLIIEQVLMRNLKTSGGLTRGSGMSEQQRTTWLLSMPACGEITKAMQELSGVNYNSGEQNKDTSEARLKRDMKDTITVLTALSQRNPFTAGSSLKNIMNGVNADNAANVDNAKAVGDRILSSMLGNIPDDFTFKRCDQAVTLASQSKVGVDNDVVQVDSQLLFQRLILASNSSDDLEAVFKYELCSYPTALFDSPLMMRAPQKPVLADAMWSKVTPEATAEPPDDVFYVLDGGALIHRIPWPKGSPTYQDICSLYCKYVSKKYGCPAVVFDGYDKVSTKSMTQYRRTSGKVGATVTFTKDMKITMKKDHFLANRKNKQLFIKLLGHSLQEIGCQVRHASGDADVLIVTTAIECAEERTTALVGDDTDLLVLLCFYATPDTRHDVYFKPERKAKSSKDRVWKIKKVQQDLGNDICNNILFLHAILGCDTTSRLHGIGKGAALKKFVSCAAFQKEAEVFSKESTPDDIAAAGEKALVYLYNGKVTTTLDALRYTRYREKLAGKTSHIQPQSLPPTSAAARYHSLRVYHQIRVWKGDSNLSAEEWGWVTRGDQMFPVMTDLPPAPDFLLTIIRCNCSTDCSTRRCTCRKNNLECSMACGQCKGSACTNSTSQSTDDDDDDEE